METDRRAHVGRHARGSAASLRAQGRPLGSERCACSGAIPRGGGALWKAFYLLSPVPPCSLPHAPDTRVPLFMSCLWANPFFLPGWRTGGGGSCLPAHSLLVLLHKTRHPHNPRSWQPSAREQGDLLISAVCSPNLLLCGQADRLCCTSVRPRGAGSASERPRPDASSELPQLEVLDHQAIGIHRIPQALPLSHSRSFSFHFGCAQGKESPGPFKGKGRAGGGRGSHCRGWRCFCSTCFWWLGRVEIPATLLALSNLPAVTTESVCLSSSPHPEFQFHPNSPSRQPLPLPWRCGFADAACCLRPSCRRISPCGRSCSSGTWSAGWGSSPSSARSSAP